MKGDIIPNAHHVTRLCGGFHIREDGTLSSTAFKPRTGEPYLSVNWLEFLALDTRDAAIAEVRRVMASKLSVGAKARLAVLNVGIACDIVDAGSEHGVEVQFRHEPELEQGRPQDPSHSGIYGVPEDDELVHSLLVSAVEELLPARS